MPTRLTNAEVHNEIKLVQKDMEHLKQGQIKKGDNLELIHRENDTMSIYEVSKLVFDKYSSVEQLKKAVEIKYLSEEIKARFINKLAKLGHYEVI